jgi:hypothetical protein
VKGLHRQCRDTLNGAGEVYKDFKVRLEDFTDRFMTSFSQSVANVVQVTLNWWLVALTILLITVTVALIIK